MSDAVTIARNDLAVNEAMDGLRVELINRARIIAFDPAVTERLDALIATIRRAALIEAAEMCEAKAKERADFPAAAAALAAMATNIRARRTP